MTTFLSAVGIGLGIGIVHSSVLFFVLFLARSNARKRMYETTALMRERNELDRQKVEALNSISRRTTWPRDLNDAVGQCIADQSNGYDALASASWDKVRELWEAHEDKEK